MKVLVTGADGFIGSHLTEKLLSQGYEVRALAQYNSFNYWGWIDGLNHKNLEVVTGDVRDPAFCQKICEGIEQVFHLAALIAIPYSYKAPHSYVDTNVNGTLNICQAALDHNVSKIFVTSTSEVYGTAREVPISENHAKQPQSPYSASKIGGDAIALSYYNAFELPVSIVRPFNTYGPRQSMRAIIPSIIVQLLSGKEEIHVGDLTPTRDLNFVGDTCEAYIKLSNADQIYGQEINICSGQEVSMQGVLDEIADIMDKEVQFITAKERLRPKNSEVFRLLGDNSRLKDLTGYSPSTSLREGLSKTIEWFSDRKNLDLYKAEIHHL